MQIWINTLIVQLSTDTRMSVLLLGSSHINRLKHYVNKLQQQEFNLNGNIIIKLFGINLGRIGNNDHCRRWETYIEQVKPMYIFVHIGGNDLDCHNCNNETVTVEEIILKTIALLDIFHVRFHINHITFVQLLERQHTRHVPVQIYNNLVKHANSFLKSQLKENKCLHYWKLTGVKNSEISLYQDGVHFNDVGNYRYYLNL